MKKLDDISNILMFTSVLGWKLNEKLENFLEIKPPTNLNLGRDFSIFIPKNNKTSDYSNYVKNLIVNLGSIYDIDEEEIIRIINQFNNEKWSKEGLLRIMKTKRKTGDNLKVYYNQSIVFGEAYIIVTFIDLNEEIKSELIMIMIDKDNKVELDGLISNYPNILFEILKEDKKEYCFNNALRIGQFKLEQFYYEKSKLFENRMSTTQIYDSINIKIISEKSLIRLILTFEKVKEYLKKSKCQDLINIINITDKIPKIDTQSLNDNQ